jgi:hypothetical protein
VSLAETRWRNRNPNADGKAPFGDRDHLARVAWHRAPLSALSQFEICEGRTKIGCPTRVSRRNQSPRLDPAANRRIAKMGLQQGWGYYLSGGIGLLLLILIILLLLGYI